MFWEKGRQLHLLYTTDGTKLEFAYNANGIRISKAVQKNNNTVEHTYVVDGTKILSESWPEGGNTRNLYAHYDNEGSICGITYNHQGYFFVKNQQGDIIAITDKDGEVIARYRYDAWGKIVAVLDADGVDISANATHIANINPFRYRGYYYDRETGLYYLQSRYYDPETGRFVNADEAYALAGHYLNSHINLFSYCNNDCANESDFYGYGIMDYIHAIGIQLCLTVDGVNFGVEFLWSTKSWKLFVFVFSGLSTSRGLKSKKGASGATSLLKKGLGSIIKKPAKTPSAILKLFKRSSISVSVMAVIGSKKQKFPSSYCGAFTGFSITFKVGFINLCLSGGKAKNQDGLIGSIAVGVSSSVGLTFGKTYYFQLTGKDAFFNNLSTFIQTMNDYAKAKLDLFRTVAGIVL